MSEGGVLSASRLSSSLVSWEVAEDSDDKVGIITLRSPKTYNALTVEMGREFEALVSSLESDLAGKNNANSQIGAIVLRGEGDKAFSAGGDLEWLRSLSQNSVHANVDAMLSFYNSFLCMREKLPVPVIASLHGPAVGASGGVPLLGFPFARLGIPSGMGALHLLQNCSGLGSSRISEIMMLGKTLTGEEAFDLGLLNRIVPRDDVEEEAISLALELVRTSHPLAVRSLVRSIRLGTNNGGGGSGLADCLYRDAHAQAMCYNRRDWGEGLEAVACKRDPNFDDYHCK
jgi:2-(1,2-epoxy-1,2-dihydrophenyl)acetyl-CoA isomerase